MDPRTVGKVGIGAGDCDRHGANAARDTLDGVDRLLNEIGRDQSVADAEQVGRAEAPLIATTNKERVLEGHLDATVDDEEAIVLAERDLRHFGLADAGVDEAFRGLPVVLGSERHIDIESGHGEREHDIAGLKRLNRDAPAGCHVHERAEEQAVRA